MQNRVRRLIGRRRGGGGGGGLDRFIGMRDPAGSQDSVLVDPISELLAQLSGAGKGGWGFVVWKCDGCKRRGLC